MSKFRFQIAISLDGFVAGPDQSEENPLGVGGMDLHRWLFELEAWRKQEGQESGRVNASTRVVEEIQSNVGATVMGRNMFGGGPGPWNEDNPWSGWWGSNPPFHSCSVTANGCLKTWATSSLSRCARSRRRASPTSSTA